MRPLALAVTVTVAGVLGLAAAPVPSEADKAVAYFPTRVGAKWVYREEQANNGRTDTRVITRHVTAVERKGGAAVVSVGEVLSEEGQEVVVPWETVTVSGDGLFRSHTYGMDFDPPYCMLKAPHKPGNRWAGETTLRDARLGLTLSSDRYTSEAHGPERLRVEAGTFQAVRVETETTRDGKSSKGTVWYSPGVGVVKLASGAVLWELQSFTPGKD